jgi:hypothetical protein
LNCQDTLRTASGRFIGGVFKRAGFSAGLPHNTFVAVLRFHLQVNFIKTGSGRLSAADVRSEIRCKLANRLDARGSDGRAIATNHPQFPSCPFRPEPVLAIQNYQHAHASFEINT